MRAHTSLKGLLIFVVVLLALVNWGSVRSVDAAPPTPDGAVDDTWSAGPWGFEYVAHNGTTQAIHFRLEVWPISVLDTGPRVRPVTYYSAEVDMNPGQTLTIRRSGWPGLASGSYHSYPHFDYPGGPSGLLGTPPPFTWGGSTLAAGAYPMEIIQGVLNTLLRSRRLPGYLWRGR